MRHNDHGLKAMPLVSVHIITYNQKQFIHQTLSSVLDQDYENIEIVVADDGSTDGTADIILDYARQYPEKIVPLVGGPNLGITGNSNRGLEACNGKYIAFMGGDDLFLPGKITRQVEWLEADPVRVLCYHDMDVFESETGKTLYLQSDKYKFYKGGADTLVLYGTYFGGTTAMVRYPRELGIFFNPKIPVASDWLFWIDIVHLQKGVVGYIEGVYARYRKHRQNITTISNHELQDNLKTLEIVEYKYQVYSKLCEERRSLVYLIAAYKSFKLKKYLDLFKYATKSLRCCKLNIRIPLKLTNKI